MHVAAGENPPVNASAFVVGPRDGAGASLLELARAIGFASVERYQGLARAEKRIEETPLVFFLCSAVSDVETLKPVADAIRFSASYRLRFAPLVYLARELSLPVLQRCIEMGFDDVVTLPYAGSNLGERILSHVGKPKVYFETGTYFGPDRRNRMGENRSLGSDHGGGEHRRFEIVRHMDRGIDIVRDDFVL